MKIKLILIFLLVGFVGRSQIVKNIAGNGLNGYRGDGGPAIDAELNYPSVVRFDHAGNMYISDTHNNVIRKINTSGIINIILLPVRNPK